MESEEPLPNIHDITSEADALYFDSVTLTSNPNERDEQINALELRIRHLGHMICRFSDSQVENFSTRLEEAQQSAIKHRKLLLIAPTGSQELEDLYYQTVEQNLALGYEVRENLRHTLNEVLPFNEKIKSEVVDDKAMSSLIQDFSLYYPSNWNQAISNKMKVNFIKGADSSYYSHDNNLMQVTNSDENFSSYRSLDEAKIAAKSDRIRYDTRIDIVHELSHKFETIEPRIVEISKSFIKRRALPITPYNFSNDGEVSDHFASPYVGTIYGSGKHFEVLPVGMESTFLGTNGSLIGLALPDKEGSPNIKRYRSDIEHRNLVTGLLAGIKMPINNEK
jgi:hypothetical protein